MNLHVKKTNWAGSSTYHVTGKGVDVKVAMSRGEELDDEYLVGKGAKKHKQKIWEAITLHRNQLAR
ncbi:hypothetical protein [Evansella clarkii]|uniref:hypothetical protein n=1 Tax=Evansella clarkii TaxID=79879 RepID=UPI000997AEF4|nr:hypothetical protein [Evansella clarkii]